jgi:hypothetical protein
MLTRQFSRLCGQTTAESIEWFLDGQFFVIWLLVIHPFPPSSHQQVVSPSQSSYLSPVELTGERRGRGCRVGRIQIKSYDRKKAWPSINHSILSGLQVSHSLRSLHGTISCTSTPFPLLYLVSKNYLCVTGNNSIALISPVSVTKFCDALNGFNALFGMMSL